MIFILVALACGADPDPVQIPAWAGDRPLCALILPSKDEAGARLVRSTVDRYLKGWYGVEIPDAERIRPGGTAIVAGTPETNPVLADLAARGADLRSDRIGQEGFRLLTHRDATTRSIIILGKTPRALKHGCQELIFFHMPATAEGGAFQWPLDIARVPSFAYRGTYMLPCWAAHDSFESWRRVLLFNSELTLNRSWFWLAGFPVAGHTGEYAGTDLADSAKVQRLFDIAAGEDTKILIGGGWFNWHHGKAVGNDLRKGIDYYLDFIDHFRNFHGFYIEPTGEGKQTEAWEGQRDALYKLIAETLERRPDFEFAIAIGKFNTPAYRARLAKSDPARVFWWWCWGDPIRDGALDEYPSVLRWHTITRMSDYHGSMDPPAPRERALAGMVTSYDPGQGFGNPWNGWAAMGIDSPRNFHPHTIPHFAHEYFFRERCWDLDITEEAFVARLHRRLFDADAPPEAGNRYWRLSNLAFAASRKEAPSPAALAPIRALVDAMSARRWTARTEDTLAQMREALGELQKRAAKESPPAG
ncbi:MAG: hypothetical protein JXP34_27210 [Planctomycetes bacterium]|nr:hypothetical protein [Planctomycetota bacterium]